MAIARPSPNVTIVANTTCCATHATISADGYETRRMQAPGNLLRRQKLRSR